MDKDKQMFLDAGFTEEDWEFYSKYQFLFSIYQISKKFTLSDVDRWYRKFKCDSRIFSLIAKVLYMYIHFDEWISNKEIKNNYKNLEKYDFVDFMDNIEKYRWIEPMPQYIAWQISKYIIE